MAAPTDLSKAWWQKNKALTLKSTGFGKALESYATAKALPYSEANIKTKIAALKAVETARAKAVGMCNKTLHGDTLKYLEAYKTLIAKQSQALQGDAEDYKKLVAAWLGIRKTVLAEMKERKKEWKALCTKLDKALVECGGAAQGSDDNAKKAAKVKAAKVKELCAEQRQKCIDTVDQNRIQAAVKEGALKVHADDKDPTDFLEIVKTQKECEDTYTEYLGLADEVLKKLG